MKPTRTTGGLVALLLMVVGLGACATLGERERPLYQRLGGREGIALVVGDFVANMAGDARVLPLAPARRGVAARRSG